MSLPDASFDMSFLSLPPYNPGRFEYLMSAPFAGQAWDFLSKKESIALMIKATTEGKPAISYLLDEIESRFGSHLTSGDRPAEDAPILINNMIKQIMEALGYSLTACALVPQARIIKSSGLYGRASIPG